MRIKQSCICRGSGKIYVLLEAHGLEKGHRMSASACAQSGASIPCQVYPYPREAGHAPGYVLVLPILDIPRCLISLREEDVAGSVVSETQRTFDFSAAKWGSRLNYKLRPELCAKIRDYDAVGEYEGASIDFWNCIEDGTEVILRCLVKLPFRENTELRLA